MRGIHNALAMVQSFEVRTLAVVQGFQLYTLAADQNFKVIHPSYHPGFQGIYTLAVVQGFKVHALLQPHTLRSPSCLQIQAYSE